MMKTYLCILRGINVSGRNIIKMNELKLLLDSLLLYNVHTYIQSGNIVFQAESKSNSILELEIKSMIAHKFSFDIPVIILTKDELETIIYQNPFTNLNLDVNKLLVTFLSNEPKFEFLNKISEVDFGQDEFKIHNKAIYLYCPNGYGNTKFSNLFFETKLKVTATTRNWKTVNQLLIIANSLP